MHLLPVIFFVVPRKRVLLTLLFLVSLYCKAQQPDDLYPKIHSLPNTSRYIESIRCLSGNCNDGNGTLVMQLALSTLKGYYYQVKIVKGSFIEGGEKFKGKVYQFETIFTNGVPKDSFDFSSAEENWKSKLVAEGDFIKVAGSTNYPFDNYFTYKYLLHGKGRDYRYIKRNGYIKELNGIYKDGFIIRADIVFTNNSTVKRFTGIVRGDYEPLAGKATFSDNSSYEGFFFENHFHGPGKYYASDKKISEGIWSKGELVEKRTVVFPAAYFSPAPASGDIPKTEYSIGFKNYKETGVKNFKGFYFGSLKNNLPEGNGFVVTDSQFLYSFFKNGQPTGSSFFRNIEWVKDPKPWINEAFENIQYGHLENGWFQSGDKINVKLGLPKSGRNYFDSASLWKWDQASWATGSFVDHELSGCGTYRNYINPQEFLNSAQWQYIVTGFFEKGKHVGWVNATIPEGYNTFFKKSGLAYCDKNGQYGGELLNMATIKPDLIRKAMGDTTSCGVINAAEKESYLLAVLTAMKEKQKETEAVAIKEDPCDEKKEANPLVKTIKVPSFFTKGITNLPMAAVVSHDCHTNKYRVVERHWVAPRKTFFQSNDNVGYYYFTEHYYTKEQIESAFYATLSMYEACKACNGTGVNYNRVVHRRGGQWEPTLLYNVYILTPERVIAAWDQRVVCSTCYGGGWIRK